MENKKNKSDIFFEEIIVIERNDINLKFIFDNIKNYIVSATVMAIGAYIFRYGSSNPIPYMGNILGIILFVIGFILYIFNFIQGTWATLKFKMKTAIYLTVNMVIFLCFTDFLWAIIKMKLIKL